MDWGTQEKMLGWITARCLDEVRSTGEIEGVLHADIAREFGLSLAQANYAIRQLGKKVDSNGHRVSPSKFVLLIRLGGFIAMNN